MSEQKKDAIVEPVVEEVVEPIVEKKDVAVEKKEPIVEKKEEGIKLTPELVEMMENRISKRLDEEKGKWAEDYENKKKMELAEQEKAKHLGKISENEQLKKQFEEWGIDYKAIDNNNLSNYINIFESTKPNTAQPIGKDSSSLAVGNVDKFLKEHFKKKFGGK